MNIAGNRQFAALAAALFLSAAAFAQDTISRKDLDMRLDDGLYQAAMRGYTLYNQNDVEGCSKVFEGALRTVYPLLDNHSILQQRISEALGVAATQSGEDRAHTLRKVIDEVRSALQTESKNAPKKGSLFLVPQQPGNSKGSDSNKEQPKDSKPQSNEKTGQPKDSQVQPEVEKRKSLDGLVFPLPGPSKLPERRTEPGNSTPKSESNGSAPPATSGKSLWERLGGESAVRAVVEDAVTDMAQEPSLDLSRGGKFTDFTKLKQGLVAYISSKSGGPLEYKGPDMKTAHAGMKITDAQFNVFKAKLKGAFQSSKYNITSATLTDLDSVIEATRNDIVEK